MLHVRELLEIATTPSPFQLPSSPPGLKNLLGPSSHKATASHPLIYVQRFIIAMILHPKIFSFVNAMYSVRESRLSKSEHKILHTCSDAAA